MAQQIQVVGTPTRGHWSSRVWPRLLPELAERIVGFLDRNEIAATFRHVNKATVKQFSGPLHTTIHISEPAPPHAFAAHWLAPGATRDLTLERRKELVRLVAASGVLPNLEVALQAAALVGAVEQAFKEAAGAGQLSLCQWLWDHSRSHPEGFHATISARDALEAAAGGGHRHVCEWLLAVHQVVKRGDGAATSAAYHGGHAELAEWLLQPDPALSIGAKTKCLSDVAHGCSLPALQRAWQRFRGPSLGKYENAVVLSVAAASPTPDWTAKIEWLEAQGCRSTSMAAVAAAGMPNDAEALARLTWLQGRGYPIGDQAVEAAARAGNMSALAHLLSEVPVADEEGSAEAVSGATEGGHLEALQALQAAGWTIDFPRFATAAAQAGHLHVLAWMLEAEPVALDEVLFGAAAQSGSVELLAWLRERGCSWDATAYQHAARSGCVAALEWLAERGCPMEEDGESYIKASCNGDLAVAHCLRRLGAPWGPPGRVFLVISRRLSAWTAVRPMLRWLLQEGCPVEYKVVEEGLADWHSPQSPQVVEGLRMLREHLGTRQPA
ncbi:hypothetical protein GPECTOR_35g886 [Gonium pectorale]|uniref:Uncharacterized protein n=1 Tax=Gonium pectorale TaxID=33097 RepID=A0A150GC98_GONPE|nr:hypothetical protein GPECTOR_35g886 [Gonium pectorale]|eukprot:KXZ47448.1 hypothetical protein GPECTOR_35g886 [Gonium pectorale]